MSVYIDKASLYRRIQNVRNQLRITHQDYPLDSLQLCSKVLEKKIGYAPFKAPALRGMAAIDKSNHKNDVILLNSARTKIEQNFDCAHEIIHTIAHRNLPGITSFNCFETVGKKQDPFIEWQANEGAAELLVPYKHFIPIYVNLSRKYARNFNKTPPEKELSTMYNVTEAVISHRINALNYEIYQYLEHGDINNIEILSQAKQQQRGWNKRHEKFYCTNCLSLINVMFDFCPICGQKLEKEGMLIYKYILRGAGYMKYDGIDVNKDGRAIECPNCKNEEHFDNAEHCIICGQYLVNYCTESINCSHEKKPLPGNARYCPYCGAKTTFFQNGYLESWDEKDSDESFNEPFVSISEDDIPF